MTHGHELRWGNAGGRGVQGGGEYRAEGNKGEEKMGEL